MKLILSISIFILFALPVFSQKSFPEYEIGSFVDIYRQLIDEYYDITYEPDKILKLETKIGNDFTPGYYYDVNYEKKTGVILFSQSNTNFKFKSSVDAKTQKIDPTICNGFVIGSDSFAVIKNFNVERTLVTDYTTERDFAEVIDQIDDLIIYKHIKSEYNNVVTTYQLRRVGSPTFISLPKQKRAIEKALLQNFKNMGKLEDDVKLMLYDYDNFEVFIKMYKYVNASLQNKKIYFNAYWDETSKLSEAVYFAKPLSYADQKIKIQYYLMDSTMLYEGSFTSLYPHKKSGLFTWYYPNGKIRKKANFIDNKLDGNITTYYKNDNVHFECKLEDSKYTFFKIYSPDGTNLLNEEGTGTEIFYDSIQQRQITRNFEDGKLKNSFFISKNGDKIYQLADKNGRITGFGEFEDILKDSQYPARSISKNVHGLILISVIFDENGTIVDTSIVKGLNKECNDFAKEFIESNFQSGIWKPGKVDKLNVKQEVIIPFDFSIAGFSRYRNNYNYMWIHQHNMMHQQMMQQQMRMMYVPGRF